MCMGTTAATGLPRLPQHHGYHSYHGCRGCDGAATAYSRLPRLPQMPRLARLAHAAQLPQAIACFFHIRVFGCPPSTKKIVANRAIFWHFGENGDLVILASRFRTKVDTPKMSPTWSGACINENELQMNLVEFSEVR